MAESTSLKTIRSISAVGSAEAAPTTASAWENLVDVGGLHFGNARAIFGSPTLGGTVTGATIHVWGREGDAIFPLAARDLDTNTNLFDAVNLGVCPPSWSFYATVSFIDGTSPEVTVDVHVQRYTEEA